VRHRQNEDKGTREKSREATKKNLTSHLPRDYSGANKNVDDIKAMASNMNGYQALTSEIWRRNVDKGNLMFLLGAGVSAAAGMPLFRSTGEKPTLCDGRKAVMKCKDALDFNDTWFRYLGDVRSPDNCRQLIGHYKVMAHFFLLSEEAPRSAFHQMLTRLASEGKIRPGGIVSTNIDGLELAAGVPEEFITSVHGTVRKLRCIQCGEIRPMTREVAERIIACSFSEKPVDVVPVHDDCILSTGSRSRQRVRRELLLFRPYVLLYNDRAWGQGVFPMFPLASRTRAGFTLVVAGSSLKPQSNAKNWVQAMCPKAKVVMVVNTSVPTALRGNNQSYLLLGSTETAAGWTLPGYHPLQFRPLRHRNPCTLPMQINGKLVTCPDPRLLQLPPLVPQDFPAADPEKELDRMYEVGPSRRRSRNGAELQTGDAGWGAMLSSHDMSPHPDYFDAGPSQRRRSVAESASPYTTSPIAAPRPPSEIIDLTDDSAWDDVIDLTYDSD